MLEYIMDLKQTSKYKAANFWSDVKMLEYLHIWMTNTQYSNIKDTFEK